MEWCDESAEDVPKNMVELTKDTDTLHDSLHKLKHLPEHAVKRVMLPVFFFELQGPVWEGLQRLETDPGTDISRDWYEF